MAGLNFLAVSMTGTGARSSLGAMETAVGGRKHRQKRSAELLQIRLLGDALTNPICGMCRRVETRVCGNAGAGVVWGAG